MKTAKIFATPATIAEVTTINACNIRIGLADFVKYTDETGVISDISDAFIDRLAYDSAVAKSGLREIFRRVKGWNENLQAIVINGTGTHDPNWNTIQQLTHDITRKYRESVLDECETMGDYAKFYDFCDALDAFQRPKPTAGELEALKKLAPHAYRDNQPMNRVFQKFCKAIGVFDEKAGSEYQKLYAQYSDELKGRKLDFKLFVSINPAHFLTMSNPIDDRRGQCLVSCHSLNRTDYSYSAGNAGYARDDVTFIVFTVANPDDAETLNNRKITRQLFMYKPYNGVLLQSRLYNTRGGTEGKRAEADLYRDLVQRAICEGEGAVNLWTTSNYSDHKHGIWLRAGDGFCGYPDWTCFYNGTIKLSLRKDKANDFKTFDIGTYGLCVQCGEELTSCDRNHPAHYCQECDPHERCYECGELLGDDDVTWAVNSHGDCVPVCQNCLESYYYFCEQCQQWHHQDHVTKLASGDFVCDDCLERFCAQCDCCNEWYFKDALELAYNGDEEEHVCEDCRRENYVYCECCGRLFHESDIDEDGLCRDCHEDENE